MPDRGEVWLADLDPWRGTEPGKRGPVLILQSQALLDVGHPSTPVDDAEPLRIRLSAAGRFRRESDLLIDQLRAIDNRRLVPGPLTGLPANLMDRVTVLEVLDLAE